MKIFITGRRQNSIAYETGLRAINFIKSKNLDFEIDKKFINIKGKSKNNFGNSADIVVCFGGDGTLLSTFHSLKKEIPVIGINCGSKGFLQAYQKDEIEKAIEDIISKNIKFEKRTRILAKIDGKIVGEALNEVLIVPEKSGRLLHYTIEIGKYLSNEAGDGLIIATPTGSTAHALSAGGPIVKGNASVFVVVPINPVDWKHRPLVINDHEKIVIAGFEKMKAEAVIDGQKWFKIKNKIELEKGKHVLLGTKN
jgi:NAD+ kinase